MINDLRLKDLKELLQFVLQGVIHIKNQGIYNLITTQNLNINTITRDLRDIPGYNNIILRYLSSPKYVELDGYPINPYTTYIKWLHTHEEEYTDFVKKNKHVQNTDITTQINSLALPNFKNGVKLLSCFVDVASKIDIRLVDLDLKVKINTISNILGYSGDFRGNRSLKLWDHFRTLLYSENVWTDWSIWYTDKLLKKCKEFTKLDDDLDEAPEYIIQQFNNKISLVLINDVEEDLKTILESIKDN